MSRLSWLFKEVFFFADVAQSRGPCDGLPDSCDEVANGFVQVQSRLHLVVAISLSCSIETAT